MNTKKISNFQENVIFLVFIMFNNLSKDLFQCYNMELNIVVKLNPYKYLVNEHPPKGFAWWHGRELRSFRQGVRS